MSDSCQKGEKEISYLWFGGPDGWQVTSFDPNKDKAIVGNRVVQLFINKSYADQLEQKIAKMEKRIENLREALLNATETIHYEFCSNEHHDFCIKATEALKEDEESK